MSRLVPLAFALLALIGAASVSACNTVAGAGEDVSSAGKAVSNTAEKAK
jgi:entericidin B